MTKEKTTLPFTEGGGELTRVGGKAKNLGELTRSGFPVPDGFTITTSAYARAAEGAEMDRILEALAAANNEDRGRLATLAGQAREALGAARIDGDVARDILDAYTALGSAVPVAVRSSATAEDLAAQSFAGQQDTYLNVIGDDALLAAVRRCWASLFTERAVVYRAQNGVDHRSVKLAVAVQRMVQAKVAGVLFTANPVSGRRRQAVIDASPGLGEAVVSGAVNPDHFIVDTPTGRALSRSLGDPERPSPCLSDTQIRDLAAMGARVEAHYGAPQDIEFAFDEDGRLWLTQARPITTLFPLPAGAPTDDESPRVYASATADEGVTRPITPMGLQAFRLLTGAWAEVLWRAGPEDRAAGPSAVVEAALRTYYDITPIVTSAIARRLARALMPSADAYSAALFGALDADPRLAPRPTPARKVLRAALFPLGRAELVSRFAMALASPSRARQKSRRAMDAVFTKGDVGPSATPEERLDRAEELLWEGSLTIPSAAFAEAAAGFLASAITALLLGRRASPEERLAAMRGLPDNPTTEMNLALCALAVELRADEASARALRETAHEELSRAYHRKELPEALQGGLGRFLDRHGHRAIAEIDLGLPRWAEDPTHLFGVLENYLRVDDASAAPDVIRRRAEEEGLSMTATLEARCAGLRGALLKLSLGRARALGGVREQWKDDLSGMFARARRLLLPVGEALVRAGKLETPDDIFFVTLPEARAGLRGEDLRPKVLGRAEEYKLEQKRRRVPAIFLSDGTEPAPEDRGAPSGNELRGTPASPGKVRGRARVLIDPIGARIDPGEVLVAPSTDPGWTPLFMTAGGLVMEKGGAISHGAVIAREYGIPAVVGVAGAIERIKTGQLIEVDGASGRVTLVPG